MKHLMNMDDHKSFTRNKIELEKLIKVGRIPNQGIGMQY